MLEIILLVFLCKGIGKILRNKGRNPLVLQIMTVLFWFGGEFAGAILGVAIAAIQNKPFDSPGLSLYLFAIAGGAVGVATCYAIAFLIPPTEAFQPQTFSAAPNLENYSQIPPSSNPYNPYDSRSEPWK